jgi:hypothetical protein
MERFRREGIPLSVCVIDMDWHITQTDNASSGWTGYTWNKDYFPDPAGFIAWLHNQGLRTCLNVHPADGVWSHEETYAEMGQRMGVDPQSQQPIPFQIHDPQFAQAYFEVLHHPHEQMGVDFWWLDLQHDTYRALPNFDPMLWMNHLHAFDLARDGHKRPFIFSRYGGLGNHRYQSAFVGDTYVTWDVMAFTPYFTATASNVNFGWWSNEIGGHFFGHQEGELFMRWVQFGAVSPALRLHSGSNPYEERHPWGYDANVFQAVRAAMRWRHRLIPYLYTMAWRNHTESIPPLLPMYYEHPEEAEAYAAPNQYYLGSELIAAPFIHKMHADLNLSRQVVWLPEGDWYHFFTGEHYAGGTWHALYGGLDEIPVFAKAGALVPLAPVTDWGGVENPAELTLRVFAGANNTFRLYEDDGTIDGARSFQQFQQIWHGNALSLQIMPIEGAVQHLPPERTFSFEFVGIRLPDTIRVEYNHVDVPVNADYDTQAETLTLSGLRLTHNTALHVTLETSAASLLSYRDRRAETVRKMLRAFRMDSAQKLHIDRQLSSILKTPSLLFTDFVLLDDPHARALSEIITGAGIDHVTTALNEDLVVMWNSRSYEGARYGWSTWNFEKRFQSEAGVTPRSFVHKEMHDRQWKLRLSYDGAHIVTMGNAYLGYKAGSTERWLEGGYRRLVAGK